MSVLTIFAIPSRHELAPSYRLTDRSFLEPLKIPETVLAAVVSEPDSETLGLYSGLRVLHMNPDLKYAGVKGPGFLSQVPTLDPYRFLLLGPEL